MSYMFFIHITFITGRKGETSVVFITYTNLGKCLLSHKLLEGVYITLTVYVCVFVCREGNTCVLKDKGIQQSIRWYAPIGDLWVTGYRSFYFFSNLFCFSNFLQWSVSPRFLFHIEKVSDFNIFSLFSVLVLKSVHFSPKKKN